MKKVQLFIESRNKQTNEGQFVQYLVDLLSTNEVQVEIFGTDGYTNLKDEFERRMKPATYDGGINLVIFDADFPETGGGFTARRDELLSLKAEHEVEFELFLFPNNQDDGTFEHLLEQLATRQHRGILSCFDGFSMCIAGHNNPNYESPDQKAKMYTYVSTQKMTQKQTTEFKNKGNWFFDNSDLWNFEAEALNPLKRFC